MKPGARIEAAIEVVTEISERHRPAADALADWGKAHRFAGSGDRSAIGNLVFDVLRHRLSLAARMGAETPRALVLGAAPAALGITPDELTKRNSELNPIERIDVLAKAKIPVTIIHGDEDVVVPLKDNSQELQLRYERAGEGALVNLIVVKGQGHNFWEGFFKEQQLVDFAIKQARLGAK